MSIGVRTELVAIDYGAWRAYYVEPLHKMALGAYGWIHTVKGPLAGRPMAAHYPSKGPLHSFAIPELDDLLARAGSTLSADERMQLIRSAVDIVFNSRGTIPVAYASELFGGSKEINGWDPIRVGGAALSWETVRRK